MFTERGKIWTEKKKYFQNLIGGYFNRFNTLSKNEIGSGVWVKLFVD